MSYHDTRTDDLSWIPENLEKVSFKELAGSGGKIDDFARNSLKNLKSTQMRKFFDEVKKLEKESGKGIDEEAINKLYILLPKLKYAKARRLCPPVFVDMFSKLIDKVSTSDNKNLAFKNMIHIFESVVAYHKYYHSSS